MGCSRFFVEERWSRPRTILAVLSFQLRYWVFDLLLPLVIAIDLLKFEELSFQASMARPSWRTVRICGVRPDQKATGRVGATDGSPRPGRVTGRDDAQPDAFGNDRLSDLYHKIIALPNRTKIMRELAETLKALITLARQTYKLDEQGHEEPHEKYSELLRKRTPEYPRAVCFGAGGRCRGWQKAGIVCFH